jgi:hypothetical protein
MNAENRDPECSVRWLGRVLAFAPLFLAAAAGVVIWEVFRPGFLDADGLGQIRMAMGELPMTDWYSPLMALSLAAAFQAGSRLSLLTLLQAVAGSVGVYWLASELLRFLSRHERRDWQWRWAALAVLLILLTPFTPLMYYLAHYRNDSLAVVFLTWAVAGWLRVEQTWNQDRHLPGSLARNLVALLLATGASVLIVVVRYNAVLVVPLFLILVALTVGRTSRKTAAVTALVLVIGPSALHEGLMRLGGVVRTHPVRQIMALELVGMCVERDDLKSMLRYTPKYLIEDRYRAAFIPGAFLAIADGVPSPPRVVENGYMSNYDRLARDYRRAIRRAPGTWLSVKVKAAFASLLDPAPHWHHRVIDPNPYGITFRDDLRAVRSVLLDIDAAIYSDPVLRFLCARHLPWVVANLVLVVLAGAIAGLSRTRGTILAATLLLLPLTYYVSHLVAVAAHDYRYMFPATLLMQILVASWAIRAGWQWVQSCAASSTQAGSTSAFRGAMAGRHELRPSSIPCRTGATLGSAFGSFSTPEQFKADG